MPNKLFLTTILLAMGLTRSLAQVDCNTERGVIALMAARVVVGGVQTAVDMPAEPGLPFRFVSELFRARQDSTTNVRCLPRIGFLAFVARDAELLRNLPDIASSNPDFTPPKGVTRITLKASYANPADKMQRNLPKTGENQFHVSGGLSANPFPAGSTLHLRIAKRITRCSSCSGTDPMVFSDTQSFTLRR